MSKLKIEIADLQPAGSDFFQDSETFMVDLKDDELYISGGITSIITNISVVQYPASEDIFVRSISFL